MPKPKPLVRMRTRSTPAGFIQVPFDPNEWPYCVDYKLRDEATVERYTECMQFALAETSDNPRPDDNTAPALYVLLTDIVDRLVAGPSVGPDEAHAKFVTTQRFMEFALTPFSWDEWHDMSHGDRIPDDLRSMLREEDPRWGFLKISMFDMVEEGVTPAAEKLLCRILQLLVSYPDFSVPELWFPYWASRHHLDLLWMDKVIQGQLDDLNAWGLDSDSGSWYV